MRLFLTIATQKTLITGILVSEGLYAIIHLPMRQGSFDILLGNRFVRFDINTMFSGMEIDKTLRGLQRYLNHWPYANTSWSCNMGQESKNFEPWNSVLTTRSGFISLFCTGHNTRGPSLHKCFIISSLPILSEKKVTKYCIPTNPIYIVNESHSNNSSSKPHPRNHAHFIWLFLYYSSTYACMQTVCDA